MTIIIDKETGEEFEVVSYLGDATHFMSGDGIFRKKAVMESGWRGPFFRRIPVTHTFGVLTLEETGETRIAEYGDFVFQPEAGRVESWCVPYKSSQEYPILKVVGWKDE